VNRSPRRVVIASAAMLALASAGLVAFFAWPASQQGSQERAPVPRVVLRFADQQHVTELVRHGSRGFAWFTGRDRDGRDVVSVGVGSGRWLTPFIPVRRFNDALAREKLHVFTADGGPTLDTVGYRELDGLVAPEVRQVKVLFHDGGSRTLPIVDSAFYYRSRIDRTHFPAKVIAYDRTGTALATKTLSRPSAPGHE
jgi:hypothetical protein